MSFRSYTMYYTWRGSAIPPVPASVAHLPTGMPQTNGNHLSYATTHNPRSTSQHRTSYPAPYM